MLGTLRKGAHSFFAKVLMGLLVASFAAWGIGDITRSAGGVPSVATVGDEEITVAEFQQQMQQLRRSFGENYSPELIQSLNLHSIKLSEMINRSLIKQEVARLGIEVTDDELLKEISNDVSFHNANGVFDKPLFLKTLQQMGVSEKTYMDSVRKEMAVRVLLATFSNYSLARPGLIDAVYGAQHEKRKVMLLLLTQAPKSDAVPDDEELQKYYESHKAGYTAPEYRAFSYAMLKPEDIEKNIEVSRQDLFEFYTQRASEFTVPQQREVDQLLYPERAEAQKAYNLLRAGKPLEAVLAEAPPKGGKPQALGAKTQDAMPAGGKEVFALDKGEFTVPIKSPFGWHIFIVTKIIPKSAAPFDSVKDDLKQEIVSQRANAVLTETLEQFEDELSAGKSLKEAAQAAGLTFETGDPVDRFGQSSDNSQAFDPQKDEELLRTAYSLEKDEHSELIPRPDGGYFIVTLDSITPPRERAFDEVRGQVLADVSSVMMHDALKTHASFIASRIESQPDRGAREKAIADVENAERTEVLLDRNGTQEQLTEDLRSTVSEDLRNGVFMLEKPGDITKAVPYEKGYAIAMLQEVVSAPPRDSEHGRKFYKAVKRSLREDYQNEILDQYLRYLRTRYPVTYNETALRSLMSEQ